MGGTLNVEIHVHAAMKNFSKKKKKSNHCNFFFLGQSTVSPGVSPSPSSVTCDFESSNLCEWKNDKTDNFDWTWKSGSTSTTNTGPTNDHTTNTASGKKNASTLL